MKPRIGVLGGSIADRETERLAEEVGREIARRGAILICGGRTGVMEAACRGAQSLGGLTVGILPGDSALEANPYVDVPIVTGLGIARNVIVVRSSQAVIAIDGRYGTLSEIAFALQLGIPVIGLKSWTVSEEIQVAGSALEAVELAFRALRTSV